MNPPLLLRTRRLCEGVFQERVRRKPGAGSATQKTPPLVLGQLPNENAKCGVETNATMPLVRECTLDRTNPYTCCMTKRHKW